MGLQKQLDILVEFCASRGQTVNVLKTKTMVFEPSCMLALASSKSLLQVPGSSDAPHTRAHAYPCVLVQSSKKGHVWAPMEMSAVGHP